MIEDYTPYNSCKRILDKEILLADNQPEFKESLITFWPSDPLQSYMFQIEQDLKTLGPGFLEKPEKNLIAGLNSLRCFVNLPEIVLLADNYESLANSFDVSQ